MTSKLVGTHIKQGYGVVFVIEHLPTDSYSRSVRRRALKAYREAGPELVKAGWSTRSPIWEDTWQFDLPAPDGMCRTAVPFTFVKPSWAS